MPNSKSIAKDVVAEFLIDVRFQNMIKGMLSDVMEDKLAKINERLNRVERRCESIERRCDQQEGEVFTLNNKSDKQCETNSNLNFRIDTLEQRLYLTDKAMCDTQQYTRRNWVFISGIPESTETDSEGKLIPEDTDKVVIELAKKELNVDLEPEDIDRTHRGARQKRTKVSLASLLQSSQHTT